MPRFFEEADTAIQKTDKGRIFLFNQEMDKENTLSLKKNNLQRKSVGG